VAATFSYTDREFYGFGICVCGNTDCYGLIGPTLSILYPNRSKKMKKLFSEEEINEVAYGTIEKMEI